MSKDVEDYNYSLEETVLPEYLTPEGKDALESVILSTLGAVLPEDKKYSDLNKEEKTRVSDHLHAFKPGPRLLLENCLDILEGKYTDKTILGAQELVWSRRQSLIEQGRDANDPELKEATDAYKYIFALTAMEKDN